MFANSRCVLAAAVVFAVVGASSCDKPSSGGSAGPSIVGGYELAAVGAVHVYEVTDSVGATYTSAMEITSASATGFTRRVQKTGDSVYSDFSYEVVGGGVFLAGSTTYSTGTTVIDYSPGSVYLPGDVTPGATLTTISSVTGPPTSYTLTREVTVNGAEQVTVPAGTFTALKVTSAITYSNGSAAQVNVTWYVAGTGRVKMVNYPAASPTTTLTYELTSWSLGGEGGAGSLDGTYDTTAIRCNGAAAPSPIADLITGPNSMTFLVAGAAGNITWSDAACSIVQPVGFAFPSAGHVTMTVAGPFGCYPDAGTCAALSTSTFGVGVCGQTDAQGARQYTFSPTIPVAAGQTVNLLRVGGEECATLAGSTDPISYVLTKQ